MVHQHFSLVEPLTVWENVMLGEPTRLDPDRARALVREIGDHYGLHLDPDATVADLSAGMRQRVELIKCLRRDPKIVILDEPTSVLTPQESQQLFHTLREVVAREGRAVALVSHKLAEIMHATDVVTIMRQGAVVDHHPTASTTAEALAQAMVGRAVSLRGAAAALGATDVVEELASEGDAAAASSQAADERPVVLDEIFLPGAAFKGLTGARLQAWKGPMYRLFEAEFGVTMVRAEEQIRAVAADAAQAQTLAVAPGAPLLSVERLAYSYAGRPMELRRGLYLTEGYHYRNDLS